MVTNKTENYGLNKPEQDDFYNVDDFNENADIIDEQLKALSNSIGNAAQESSLDIIDEKIGETGDTNGTKTSGTVFGKLNKVITDNESHTAIWTSTRAGYIDAINTNASNASARAENAKNNTATNNTAKSDGILSQKLSYIISNLLGTVNATGGTTAAGTVMAKLNALLTNWTSTRAGYIDTINTNASNAAARAENAKNNTATNNTASKTGILSQKESYTISLLENTTYGLSAIKTSISTVGNLTPYGKIAAFGSIKGIGNTTTKGDAVTYNGRCKLIITALQSGTGVNTSLYINIDGQGEKHIENKILFGGSDVKSSGAIPFECTKGFSICATGTLGIGYIILI